MPNTCHCTVGMVATPHAFQMLQHCGCLSPMRQTKWADPEQWLFLDTETTGLAGGTGTYPFLVGIAWWEGGGLEVEQLFMREYSEERSLLAALAERLARASRFSHVQRQIIRLAVTGNAVPDDANYCSTRTASPP